MIKLLPSFKEKVWGSTKLEPLFPNSKNKIGEIWFEGAVDLPLLVKFLFTTEKLSVQVHPNDDYARIHHNSPGKTEMWHILAAEPGAQIAAGFREPITKERLRDASLSGEIETLLHWYDAQPGDTFFIPAGTVHAIGAGLTLCEIQQYSDVTYRLYDYGRPRELHLDEAMQVSDLGPHNARASAAADVLVSCKHFITKYLQISNPTKFSPGNNDSMLIAIGGSGTLNGEHFSAGEVRFFASGEPACEISGNLVILAASNSQAR